MTTSDNKVAPDGMLTVAELAAELDVSERTVRRWVAQERIPYHQPAGPGTALRFRLSEVTAVRRAA